MFEINLYMIFFWGSLEIWLMKELLFWLFFSLINFIVEIVFEEIYVGGAKEIVG